MIVASGLAKAFKAVKALIEDLRAARRLLRPRRDLGRTTVDDAYEWPRRGESCGGADIGTLDYPIK
jgi:hypothetical protein